jgi:hypothetical protein
MKSPRCIASSGRTNRSLRRIVGNPEIEFRGNCLVQRGDLCDSHWHFSLEGARFKTTQGRARIWYSTQAACTSFLVRCQRPALCVSPGLCRFRITAFGGYALCRDGTAGHLVVPRKSRGMRSCAGRAAEVFSRQDDVSDRTFSLPAQQVCTVAVNALQPARHAAVPVPSCDRSCHPSPQWRHRAATLQPAFATGYVRCMR